MLAFCSRKTSARCCLHLDQWCLGQRKHATSPPNSKRETKSSTVGGGQRNCRIDWPGQMFNLVDLHSNYRDACKPKINVNISTGTLLQISMGTPDVELADEHQKTIKRQVKKSPQDLTSSVDVAIKSANFSFTTKMVQTQKVTKVEELGE